MTSEQEDVEEELEILLREEKWYLMREKSYPFRKSDDFKRKFTEFSPTICTNCGRYYRITHFCDLINGYVWLDNWKERLLTHFKSLENISAPANEYNINIQKNESFKPPTNQSFETLKSESDRFPSGVAVACCGCVIFLFFILIFIMV